MKITIRVECPTLAQLRGYLERTGWTQCAGTGGTWDRWEKADDYMFVPRRETADMARRISEELDELATFERRSSGAVYRDIVGTP